MLPLGCRGRGVTGAISDHGPEDVKAAPCRREQRLGVGFSLHAFAVVVGPGGGAGLQCGERGQVEDPEQPPVVASGPMVIAADSP